MVFKRYFFVTSFMIVFLIFIIPTVSHANPDALAEKESELATVIDEMKQVHFELTELQVVVDSNNDVIEEMNEQIEAYKAEIADLKKDVRRLQESIKQRDEILKTRLQSYQASGGNSSFLEVIFNARDFGDFISRFVAVTQITTADADMIQQQVDERNELELLQTAVSEKLDEQEIVRKEYVDSNRIVLKQYQHLVSLQKQLEEKEVLLESERNQLQGESLAAFEAMEAEMRAEMDQVEQAREESNANIGDTNNNGQAPQENMGHNDYDGSENETNNSSPAANDSNNNVNKPKEEKPKEEKPKDKPKEEKPKDEKPKEKPKEDKPKEEKPKEEKPKDKPKEESKPGNQAGTSVITIAYQQLGIGVKYSTTDTMNPGVSFDCSGYVTWVFQQAGKIPPVRYTTSSFATTGTKIDYASAQPGDLVFFNTTGRANSHVGIYLGNGQFIGSQTSTGVAVASMSNTYWKDTFEKNGMHVRRIN